MATVTSGTALGFDPHAWLAGRQEVMVEEIQTLANINSGTRNFQGVDRVAEIAAEALKALGAEVERVAVDPIREIGDDGQVTTWTPARAVVASKRAKCDRRVLLSIHLDTVFDPSSGFDVALREAGGRMVGPGVIDAKGGLVVMLEALRAFEQTPAADGVGWTVVLNTDEEVGSPGSRGLLEQEAKAHAFGLVFEPALPDGAWVCERKGSGNFAVVFHGKAVHAGRDFASGRNAVVAMSEAMHRLASLSDESRGLTVNVAKVSGGGALNVVPDLAVGRVNVRVVASEDAEAIEKEVRQVAEEVAKRHGCTALVDGAFYAPPKPWTDALAKVHARVKRAAAAVGLTYHDRASGGVCDGNRLTAAGCPTVDTMGPVGDDMHSTREWLDESSLVERAQVALSVLMQYAQEKGEAS